MTGRRAVGPAVRIGAGAAVVAALVWRLGAGPFVDGLRMVDAPALLAAVAIGAVTTTCCAWRWRAVARGLGVDVGLGTATASYYRSLFLNSTLPGGVAGDVHRAVRHGRDAGDLSRGARAVAWERLGGQGVQVAVTVVVLLLLPSPIGGWRLALALGLVVGMLGLLALARHPQRRARTRLGRAAGVARADLSGVVLARETWPVVVVASCIVVLGHAATFVVAARTAGVDAPLGTLAPIALLVLVAMSVPLGFAGWGVREGAAAWAFAAAGLGAASGVSTGVVYGVIALAAVAPGAAVLLLTSFPRLPSKEALHG
jgi:glycosyltransferase 2 family protein